MTTRISSRSGNKLTGKQADDSAHLHLGNAELHRRHAVMIEPGTVPRARVMDQHLIDRYLMGGVLTLGQHMAGEFLLGQASRARVWPTGLDWRRVSYAGGQRNYVPFGVLPFGDTLTMIRHWCGPDHERVVVRVIYYERDVRHDSRELQRLCSALDFVDSTRVTKKRGSLAALRAAMAGS